MATVSTPSTHTTFHLRDTKVKIWAIPLGRFCYSLLFIAAGLNHFNPGTIDYAAQQGVPMANILVPFSGLMAVVGGLSILFGYYARVGAGLIILFLIPVTYSMHHFWTITDPAMYQMQMVQFMKNLALLGGAVLIAFYGAGSKSIDLMRPKKNVV